MRCPKCAYECPVDFNFCPKCGTGLADVISPPFPVFSQPDQNVRQQINVVGNYYDQRSASTASPETCDPQDAMPCYLSHVIESNRRLPLQGIRSSSGPVSIELEEIYVTLTATVRKTVTDEDWIEAESRLAPGEAQRSGRRESEQKVKVKVQEALKLYSRLAVLGDPGSGKTTLLRYLALTYARNWQTPGSVKERLGLNERRLPIFLPLRDFARNLEKEHPDNGADGPKLLLDYMRVYFENQQITMPVDFFPERLKVGECAVLLDGMDEVASMETRQRVARIIEKFTVAYPQNRYVVTSRIVGYTGGARLGEGYEATTVRDFTDEDIACFVRYWNKVVEMTLAGAVTEYALREAERQSESLIEAIRGNSRVRELAVNPLLLTVIALVHRYRAQLPERRVELYEEALEVLLAQWDGVKGISVSTTELLQGLELDSGERGRLLEPVALRMMEQQVKEIDVDELRRWLEPVFYELFKDRQKTVRAVVGFIQLINERSGLLTERGQGIYGFSHLTFQEYLAARALVNAKAELSDTLEHVGDAWWREVVLLEVGYLGKHNKSQATKLIQALMNEKKEPEPFYNLILAAEAVRDVGAVYVGGDLWKEIQQRFREELARPLPKKGWIRWLSNLGVQPKIADLVRRRAAAAEALGRIENGSFGSQPLFWQMPYGEPVWCEVPAGEFWMGSKNGLDWEKPLHRVYLERYGISKTPVTNAQYRFFVEGAKYKMPYGWENGQPPKGKENHPVVNVDWADALAYCQWLSKVTVKPITLPSEAEWEKAARGDRDQREYSWGVWEDGRANTNELGLGDTTPVGIFPEGASPYGCLDMAGNVWEWTRTLWRKDWNEPEFKYLYYSDDGREDLNADKDFLRVIRGGAFLDHQVDACCARRFGNSMLGIDVGFRVVIVLRNK